MRKITVWILLGLLLGSGIFSSSSSAQQFFFFENEAKGQPAPDFTLDTVLQKGQNFTKLREGSRAIVFFWATWCPHCREELKVIKQKLPQFADKKVKIILVNLGEKEKVVKKHMEKNLQGLDSFIDEKESLAEPYYVIGLPTLFFIDEKGVVVEVLHTLPENYEIIFEPQNE